MRWQQRKTIKRDPAKVCRSTNMFCVMMIEERVPSRSVEVYIFSCVARKRRIFFSQ
jgi:hypothetical protein